MRNQAIRFEIPAKDIERAAKFYSGVFRSQMHIQRTGSSLMGYIPNDGCACKSKLIYTERHQSSENGVLVYISSGSDLNTILRRVPSAGGEVVVPKTLITREIGYFGVFLDTEGNRLALHSQG